MGTYKVLQDIEAEDKFIGPLTLKQFIFAGITAICLYLSVFFLTRGVPYIMFVLMPPAMFFGFLAWPWGKDQPTETWLLAKLRFMFKPRKRIWDQSGIKELVTITAPKREEKVYTDGLSQTEVKSRLQALANTIDSRGWAVKNVNINLYAQPSYISTEHSDRLLDPNMIPQEVANYDVRPSEDMLDERNNPTAQQLNNLMNASEQAHRKQIMTQLQQAAAAPPTNTSPAANPQTGQPVDYWFMNQPAAPPAPGMATFQSSVVTPGVTSPIPAAKAAPTADEQKLLEKIHKQKSQPAPGKQHLRTIQPLGQTPTKPLSSEPVIKSVGQAPTPSPAPSNPAILELANNDDLNVETIARQASKTKKEPPADEVVISLH